MPYQLWSQDNFSKGELSPYLYARAQVQQYYQGLKTAQNVLTYPTGAAGKRFGTLYNSTITGLTAFDQLFFQTFQFLDIATYQLVFTPLQIAIYFEGALVATVVTTFDANTVYNLDYTVIGGIFRVAAFGYKPYDLTVTTDVGVTITSIVANEFVLATPALAGIYILPAKFINTGGIYPVTSPQIKVGIVYYIRPSSSTHFAVYTTVQDAVNQTNAMVLSTIGTGTNKVHGINTWSFTHTTFKNLPVFDFTGGYDAITFTPGATTGDAVSLTASGAIFTAGHVGGAFFGGGGTARITSFIDSTDVLISIQNPFDSTNAILGSLALLTEPAWSDARGWPIKCSSYQNRALFANTQSLQNGFWASVVNDYSDFGDLTTDADDAISWYPTSNNVNVIRYIVPFRSITIHTNTGIYSSPLSSIEAITPSTFTLQLQDSTPADVLEPQAIDNQIIVLSGNDVHTMVWDGINNAYNSSIVSIINEQTIRDPVDETPFADLRRAGSRYVFIINANGSMAIYQTLLTESVSGFTPHIMEQSYGSAKFLQAASSADGRCWFVVQRQIAEAVAPINIVAFTSNTLTAISSNYSTTVPTAVKFTTSGSLPTSTPALAINTYYWVIGVTADIFKVYESPEDAENDENAIVFTNAGTSSQVVGWLLNTIFTLEELSQDVHLDCAVYYNGVAASTIPTGVLFNAQQVKMVGNGFGFDAEGIDNAVTFKSHGSLVPVTEAYIGFPINTVMEPMPLSMPAGPETSLTKPNHVRSVRFMFNNTIGGTINGVPISLVPFDESDIGQPPVPARGVFEMSIMKGWDDFNNPTFTIEHNEPFNIELIGVFYSVDT